MSDEKLARRKKLMDTEQQFNSVKEQSSKNNPILNPKSYDEYINAVRELGPQSIQEAVPNYPITTPEDSKKYSLDRDEKSLDKILEKYPDSSNDEIMDMIEMLRYQREGEIDSIRKMNTVDKGRQPANLDDIRQRIEDTIPGSKEKNKSSLQERRKQLEDRAIRRMSDNYLKGAAKALDEKFRSNGYDPAKNQKFIKEFLQREKDNYEKRIRKDNSLPIELKKEIEEILKNEKSNKVFRRDIASEPNRDPSKYRLLLLDQ